MKKTLVTGGAGFIGSHLVDALLEIGCEVTVIDNLSTGKISNLSHVQDKIDFHEGDIQELKTMNRLAEGSDAIFHQAAVVSVPMTVTDPIGSSAVNDLGTLTVLESARMQHVKRVVLASSCAVYGDAPEVPKRETMVLKPQSPYAVQKLTNELYARLYTELYGIETVCLRYFNVYGPRQDPSSPYSGVISIFMAKAVKKERPNIYGDGRQYRDFVFVKDVVRANLLGAAAGGIGGEIFNVGTEKYTRINELWEMISSLSGEKIDPRFEEQRAGDIVESVADIGKAKSLLGFKPDYEFKEGLRRTFMWYQDQDASSDS